VELRGAEGWELRDLNPWPLDAKQICAVAVVAGCGEVPVTAIAPDLLRTATFLAALPTLFTWLATSGAAAPQLPAEVHDTASIPGRRESSWRSRHLPLTWLIAKPRLNGWA